MKKVVLSVLILFSSVFAHQLGNSFWINDNQKQINVTCSNGTNSFIYYFPEGTGYHYYGDMMYATLEEAVNSVCN